MATIPEPRSTCPIGQTLDIVGDRWTLLVIRDIALKGVRHFRDLAADEDIATNVLADRLARLRQAGLITETIDPDDRRRKIYNVTAEGKALVPVLVAIARWGADHLPGVVAPDAMFAHAEAVIADG